MKTLGLLFLTMLICNVAFTQDIITFKNGDEIKGKVTRVAVNEIEYKKDSLSPLYTVKKSEVFMIKYQNGSKDIIESLATENNKKSCDDLQKLWKKKKANGLGLTITGGALLVVGTSLVASSLSSRYSYDQSYATAYVGFVAMAASIPLLITGPIQFAKYARAKKKWKEEKCTLSYYPNVNLHSYGLGLNLTF